MGKQIILAVLAGLLVLGFSAAFAEEPQLTEQEILKAWGQAQAEVQEMVPATTKGKQVLSDENLDEINAAGTILGMNCGPLCFQNVTNIGNNQITSCVGAIAKCSATGGPGKTGPLVWQRW